MEKFPGAIGSSSNPPANDGTADFTIGSDKLE
jgi:hypothetical protein